MPALSIAPARALSTPLIPPRGIAAAVVVALLVCAGCSRPQPAETDPPPEPRTAQQATELRDAIQQPLDQAKAVKQATEGAGQAQRAAIDTAIGG